MSIVAFTLLTTSYENVRSHRTSGRDRNPFILPSSSTPVSNERKKEKKEKNQIEEVEDRSLNRITRSIIARESGWIRSIAVHLSVPAWQKLRYDPVRRPRVCPLHGRANTYPVRTFSSRFRDRGTISVPGEGNFKPRCLYAGGG